MAPRRPRIDDDDAPKLPPLDGEDDEPLHPPLDGEDDVTSPEEPASLDDTPAGDMGSDDAIDTPEEAFTGADDPGAEGLAETQDDADEIDADDGARWTDPDPSNLDTGTEDLDLDEGSTLGDRGEEGPEDDAMDDVDALPPLDDDPGGDETDDGVDPGHDPGIDQPVAAFSLPDALSVSARRIQGDGVMLGATLAAGRLLVVGDALWSVALDALSDPDAALAPLDSPDDELFTAVAEDDAGSLYLGTLLGGVYQRARRDAWRLVRHPGVGRAAGAVDVVLTEGRCVWARTRGGLLLRGEEGAWRDVPGMPEPVRGITRDPDGAVVLVAGGRGRPELRATSDGGRTWTRGALPGTEAPWLLARAGEVTVVAPGAGPGPGQVSVDGGRTWARWDLLDGATALALAETDDGVALVLFAVHQEAEDRSVVVAAGVDASGGPVAPRRLCLVEAARGDARSDDGDDEPVCRVEALVPLDRAGRRIAVVASRQVLLVERGG